MLLELIFFNVCPAHVRIAACAHCGIISSLNKSMDSIAKLYDIISLNALVNKLKFELDLRLDVSLSHYHYNIIEYSFVIVVPHYRRCYFVLDSNIKNISQYRTRERSNGPIKGIKRK
jgi:hypothetical protein